MPKPFLGKVLGPKAGIQLGIFLDFKKKIFSLHPNNQSIKRHVKTVTEASVQYVVMIERMDILETR